MKEAIWLLLILIVKSAVAAGGSKWTIQQGHIQTRWAAFVTPATTLPEYPRPQLVRKSWRNLNGLWQYAITKKSGKEPLKYDGQILVPFAIESALSGVARRLEPDQLLWYQRTITVDRRNAGSRTLLHFGAVDYEATVYINGREIGAHKGGYEPFTFDISDKLARGDNSLVVRVWDPTDTGSNPHGKQSLLPMLARYTAASGIWQTVWLETVPETYIEAVNVTPDIDDDQARVNVQIRGGDGKSETVEVDLLSGSRRISRTILARDMAVAIKNPHLWSPEDPFLYGLKLRVRRNSVVLDEVDSYFGMRKVEVRKSEDGTTRILLNNEVRYNFGVLDQGFWPDGLYTAPTDKALEFDIKVTKAMGFNAIRKHLKVEPERWYYHCDRLGIMVWQDMVAPANGTQEARDEFEKEVRSTVAQLRNHPSVIAWILFNERYGSPYDQARLTQWIRQMDPTRLVDSHSGPVSEAEVAKLIHTLEGVRHLQPTKELARVLNWGTEVNTMDVVALMRKLHNDAQKNIDASNEAKEAAEGQVVGDILDTHDYGQLKLSGAGSTKARVLGELGGVGELVHGHVWSELAPGWSYKEVPAGGIAEAYSDVVDKLVQLKVVGLSGSIYTQLYDVETEQNGLMTFDREVTKAPIEQIARINSALTTSSRRGNASSHRPFVQQADQMTESERYAALLVQYRHGRRGAQFLKTLACLAVRLGDQPRLREIADRFISRMSPPYSRSTWEFIRAVTRSSEDKGFDILRKNIVEADGVLGEGAAEMVIRNIIGREEIEPRLKNAKEEPDWAEIARRVEAKFGPLGAEEAYGTAMIHYAALEKWTEFGKYFALYFGTASGRSEYPINNLSYDVFEHVEDRSVLEMAIQVQKQSMESNSRSDTWQELFGVSDASALDTYACLLYKVGRLGEAMDWDSKAYEMSEGYSPEITAHLAGMRAGKKLWSQDGAHVAYSRAVER